MFSEVTFSPFLITMLVIFTILSAGAVIACEKQRRKARAENKVWELPEYFSWRYFCAVSFFILMLKFWIRLFASVTSGPPNQ